MYDNDEDNCNNVTPTGRSADLRQQVLYTLLARPLQARSHFSQQRKFVFVFFFRQDIFGETIPCFLTQFCSHIFRPLDLSSVDWVRERDPPPESTFQHRHAIVAKRLQKQDLYEQENLNQQLELPALFPL